MNIREEWRVETPRGPTSVIAEVPDGGATATFVCAHGAGGSMVDRGLVATAQAFLDRGIAVVRFNFLYRERGRGGPDPMPVLQETVAAVVGNVRTRLSLSRLIIGGRSMGGRAASMLAAAGYEADGLLLLAYPLHPAGKPEQLRAAHLAAIRMPVLCCNGTRDALCTRSLMTGALAAVTAPWTMHWVEAADHSFHVVKASGRTDAGVLGEIADVGRAWVADLP